MTTEAIIAMRRKSKLRVHGWAGETSDAEATYIQGWLQDRMDKHGIPVLTTLADARRYARGE